MKLLIVEDEQKLRSQLCQALEQQTYKIEQAKDGEEALYMGLEFPIDLAIVDLGLPKINGVEVIKRWRKAGIVFPILILTARGNWQDKVEGLDAGADDYVTKPFVTEEVLARIRALLRRAAGHASSELECGALRIDTRSARVTFDGEPIKLTSLEYRLLAYLMHHREKVISRTELVEHLYDQDFDRDSNTIEVFVGRLRRKIGKDVIETVRGLGYRLASVENSKG